MMKKGDRVVVKQSNGNLKGEVVGFADGNKVTVHLDGKPRNMFKIYEEDRLAHEDASGRYPWNEEVTA